MGPAIVAVVAGIVPAVASGPLARARRRAGRARGIVVTTLADPVRIAHPLRVSIGAIVTIFVGTGFATTLPPAIAR